MHVRWQGQWSPVPAEILRPGGYRKAAFRRSAAAYYDIRILTGEIERVGVVEEGVGEQGWRRDMQILVRETGDISKTGQ